MIEGSGPDPEPEPDPDLYLLLTYPDPGVFWPPQHCNKLFERLTFNIHHRLNGNRNTTLLFCLHLNMSSSRERKWQALPRAGLWARYWTSQSSSFSIIISMTSLTSCRLVSKVLDQPVFIFQHHHINDKPYLVQACEQDTGPALPRAGLWARYWTSQSSSFSIIISMMGSGMNVSSYTKTCCYIVRHVLQSAILHSQLSL
jgi:hypothetical protein